MYSYKMSGRQFFSESEKLCLHKLILKYHLNSRCTNPAIKRTAWIRLVEEYNSIETNTKRTVAQLKKCWDNLKTRKKLALIAAKRERMKTGQGPYDKNSGNSQTSQDVMDIAGYESTDVEQQFSIESDIFEITPQVEEVLVSADPEIVEDLNNPLETGINLQTAQIKDRCKRSGSDLSDYDGTSTRPSAKIGNTSRSGSRLSDYDAASQISDVKNITANVITDAFEPRQLKTRDQEREEQLHKLKLAEQKWLVKTAEETYKKACIERQSAEEELRCNRAKRDAADLLYISLKNKNIFLM